MLILMALMLLMVVEVMINMHADIDGTDAVDGGGGDDQYAC